MQQVDSPFSVGPIHGNSVPCENECSAEPKEGQNKVVGTSRTTTISTSLDQTSYAKL